MNNKEQLEEIARGIAEREIREREEAKRKSETPEDEDEKEENESEKAQVIVNADINPKEYIQVPQHNLVIAKYEPDWTKGKQWVDNIDTPTSGAHFVIQKKGFFMPGIEHFTTHFMNVKEAYDSKGKSPLFYADGSDVLEKEIEELWNYFSSKTRKEYPNGNTNCWTWLDALFREKNGKWFMETEHRVVNRKLEHKTIELDCPIRNDYYVNLDFNSQGFPINKSGIQDYEKGQNIYFWHPRNNSVAGFFAGSNWANLYCGRYPQDSNSSLGVFPCAEGAGGGK